MFYIDNLLKLYVYNYLDPQELYQVVLLLTFCLLLLLLWESVIVLFCCTLLYVHSSIAIILIGKLELVALLNLSFWCLMMVEWLFAVPLGCLRFVIVVFPDHTHYFRNGKNRNF